MATIFSIPHCLCSKCLSEPEMTVCSATRDRDSGYKPGDRVRWTVTVNCVCKNCHVQNLMTIQVPEAVETDFHESIALLVYDPDCKGFSL